MELGKCISSLQKPPVQGWTSKLIYRGVTSATVGMLLGMGASIMVNTALVEISISRLFAIYYGLLSIAVGGVIAWRLSNLPLPDPGAWVRRTTFMALAGLVMFSGFICILMRKSWISAMPKSFKIVFYALLGLSLAFALFFSAIDLLNLVIGLCQLMPSRNPIESQAQVYLVIVTALLLGVIFGMTFGALDTADEIQYHVKLSLLREEQYCYPVGAVVGALAGFANEYLRNQAEGYSELKRDEFETDI